MEKPLPEQPQYGPELKIHDYKVDPVIKYGRVPDQKIWEDFKSGDESAFIHIYSTFFKELISFGYQFCRDDQLVEDCVQDLFVDLRRKRKKLSPIRNSIRLYLFQGLKRRVIDYQKKLNKTNRYSNLSEDYVFEVILPHETFIIDEQNYNETIEKLNRAVQKLTIRQREALYYLYYNSMTYEEIRILMGMGNVKSVRNLIYKAITALKPLIGTSIFFLFIFLWTIHF